MRNGIRKLKFCEDSTTNDGQIRPDEIILNVREEFKAQIRRLELEFSAFEQWLVLIGAEEAVIPLRQLKITDRASLEWAIQTGRLNHLRPSLVIQLRGEGGIYERDNNDYSLFGSDKETRQAADIVHQTVEFRRWIWTQVIDTAPVQRLRNLKQLGMAHYVYPGATHTRFVHSLGVGYLGYEWASRLAKKLIRTDGIHWVNALKDSVCIAGLCHDLGHGPFSHAFETFLANRNMRFTNPLNRQWKHEEMSLRIFDYLVDECHSGLGNTVDVTDTRNIIRRIIRGNTEKEKQKKKNNTTSSTPPPLMMNNSCFLADRVESFEKVCGDIIANHDSGCDVDRFDYLKRDAIMTVVGLTTAASFSPDRLMNYSAIVKDSIAFNFKERMEIFNFFNHRFQMFHRVYTHPKLEAIECMLGDVMSCLDEPLGLSQSINDVEEYLRRDDYTIESWINTNRIMNRNMFIWDIDSPDIEFEPNLIKAEKIIQRIKDREIYTFVGEICVGHEESESLLEQYQKEIFEAAVIDQHITNQLKIDEIVLHETKVDYGIPTTKNSINEPWDAIKFYYDQDDHTLYNIPQSLRIGFPTKCQYTFLRIFCKDPNIIKINSLDNAITKWIANKQNIHHPDLQQPLVQSPSVRSPFVRSPFLRSPSVRSPFVRSPFVRSPFVRSPSLLNTYRFYRDVSPKCCLNRNHYTTSIQP